MGVSAQVAASFAWHLAHRASPTYSLRAEVPLVGHQLGACTRVSVVNGYSVEELLFGTWNGKEVAETAARIAVPKRRADLDHSRGMENPTTYITSRG